MRNSIYLALKYTKKKKEKKTNSSPLLTDGSAENPRPINPSVAAPSIELVPAAPNALMAPTPTAAAIR